MFGHVSGQNHVDDTLPHELVRVPVQVVKDVHTLVRRGKFEPQRGMMVLQYRDVIVQIGQFATRVAQKGTESQNFFD